jgi:hypothetical protein
MRISLLEDVIRTRHIVWDVLMSDKPSDISALPRLLLVSLMHMVTVPSSSGPVEGPINRLSRRFVRAPGEGQGQAIGPRAPSQVHAAAA